MVAAKFEPQENWLPPGYVIKKNNAYQGLNVIIASVKSNKRFRKQSNSEKAAAEEEEKRLKELQDDVCKEHAATNARTAEEQDAECEDDKCPVDVSDRQENIIRESKTSDSNVQIVGDVTSEREVAGKNKSENTRLPEGNKDLRIESHIEIFGVEGAEQKIKFEQELLEATKQEEAMRNEMPGDEEKTLIPYNLQVRPL